MTADYEKRRRVARTVRDLLHNGKSKAEYMKDFKITPVVAHPKEAEMAERIVQLIYEYEGEVGLAATIGVLNLVTDQIKADNAGQ